MFEMHRHILIVYIRPSGYVARILDKTLKKLDSDGLEIERTNMMLKRLEQTARISTLIDPSVKVRNIPTKVSKPRPGTPRSADAAAVVMGTAAKK